MCCAICFCFKMEVYGGTAPPYSEYKTDASLFMLIDHENFSSKCQQVRLSIPMNACLNCSEPITAKNTKRKFCNNSCSAKFNNKSRVRTADSKLLTSTILKAICPRKNRICVYCKKEFIYPGKVRRKTCSNECNELYRVIAGRRGGLVTSNSPFTMRSRSKNEREFARLIALEFNDVICNKRMFNEFDSDVIIPSLQIAIHWNGPFHYFPYFGNEKLLQIQNRDEQRYLVIESFGYVNYIIDDSKNTGYDPLFVSNEFAKFKQWLNGTPSRIRTYTTPVSPS